MQSYSKVSSPEAGPGYGVLLGASVLIIVLTKLALRLIKSDDDPYGSRVPDEGGFLVKTEVKPSANPVAGRARYVLEDVKAGDAIRVQPIDSSLLVSAKNAEELSGHLARGTIGLEELADFGHTTSPGCPIGDFDQTVFVNKPHLFCNHWPKSQANMETVWTKKYKIIRALRDIKAGVEIKHCYNAASGYRTVEWYNDFMAEQKTSNVMQWVCTLSPAATYADLTKT